jgi:ribose-phosphate pyrophosphokinase
MGNRNPLKIFSGNAHPALAKEVCEHLQLELGQAEVGRFPDGEVEVQIGENVRGADVFVVQPTSTPVNDHLMELLIMLDAFRRASAYRITAVMPYYGYARQDRKDRPRVPISAKLVADLLTTAGANRILTLDLHAGQIQGYFNIPVDHLYATPVTVDYFRKLKLKNLTVISPDTGGVERARSFAKKLRAPLAIIDKRRENADTVEVMNVIGDVAGRAVLIVDDMIDTGGTLVRGAETLKEKGAEKVFACCVHGVFARDAVSRICDSELELIVASNSIPLSSAAQNCARIKILSVAKLFAEAIRSIHDETSVSRLFI